MRSVKLAFLALMVFSLAIYLSGCGPTNQEPNASFSADLTSGKSFLEVSFEASNSSDPDGSIVSYGWDFGNGSTGSGKTTNHTFDNSGNYDVELTVTDAGGATDTTTKTISVTNQSPNASFSVNHTSGEAVSFNASGSSDSDGSVASYEWNFDDGSTGSGEAISHTFDSAGEYTVELIVTDDQGATDSTTKSISVSPPPNESPNASFSVSQTSGEAPLDVTFDASGSFDSDGNITNYQWDFDDGSTSSGVNVTHTFDSEGTYNLELTVTDNDGATDSTNKTLSVSTPTNNSPIASFTATPTSGEVPLDVDFDPSGSSDPDGNIVSYNWDFGDGLTDDSGVAITHIYNEVGSYTAKLTVTDKDGATDSDTETIEVTTSGNESPTAKFSYDPSSGYPPLEVTFDATSSSDSDGSVVAYNWDFDDGTGSSGAIITHTYYDSGVYDVTLTVYDDDGASSTQWYSVWVK